MTPCEKLGYKVGDTFIVLRSTLEGVVNHVKYGEYVILDWDDDSTTPRFMNEERTNLLHLELADVKLVNDEGWIKNDFKKPEHLPEFVDIKWKNGTISLRDVAEGLYWELRQGGAAIDYWRPHVAKSSCKVDEDTLAQPDTITPVDNQDASKRNTGRFSITQMYTLRNVLGEEILTTDRAGLEELNNLIGELLHVQENHPL